MYLSASIPSRISMLHLASPHSFSPAAPISIESTATVKLVSSKCGCLSHKWPQTLVALLKAGSLGRSVSPSSVVPVYTVSAVRRSPVLRSPLSTFMPIPGPVRSAGRLSALCKAALKPCLQGRLWREGFLVSLNE